MVITMNYIKDAMEYSIKKIADGIEIFGNLYPQSASVNNIYGTMENVDWTNGFWCGMLWIAYEYTKDEKYKSAAMKHVADFYERIEKRINVDHHDMGFLYMPSCVAAYKLTGDETAKKAALAAADNMCGRFCEKGGFIQAWGELGAKENYRLIIDCLLNIPLLFWAAEETGNGKYEKIAKTHLNTTLNVIFREDYSTYHTYYFDPKTGEPLYGATHQGYSDDSIWARGQAWGVYGLALAYRYTKDKRLIGMFIKVTELFLSHLPSDSIPAWDLIFTDTKTLKDTSAAVIVICGILEMDGLCKIPKEFVEKAKEMLDALCQTCLTKDIKDSNGILKHGVYSMPHKGGIDECMIWGDYYFTEALMRMLDAENSLEFCERS